MSGWRAPRDGGYHPTTSSPEPAVPPAGPAGTSRRPVTARPVEDEPLHEQLCQLAHEIEDDEVAERLIHLAAQVRRLERARPDR